MTVTETTKMWVEDGDFKPIRVLQVELAMPLPQVPAVDPVSRRSYERALVLVRLHTQPIGVVQLDLPPEGLSADAYAGRIWGELSRQIRAHLILDGLPLPAELGGQALPTTSEPTCIAARQQLLRNAPFASIVICTRDRPDTLDTTLCSLSALEYPEYEIIIVDNAPSTDAAAVLIREKYGSSARVRYVREDRPGLSWARNRGVAEARGEIVAFTDDDVVVDRHWLAELVKGFDHADNVGCVTGLTPPLQLETPTQAWFEQFGSFHKRGFEARVFDMDAHRPANFLYPYTPGMFGRGNNMAFRVSALSEVGLFDPALGAGSPTLCGEEHAVFVQLIEAGYRIVYEPGALAYHLHRRDYEALEKQVYGMGVGTTAFLTKCVLDRPARLVAFAARAPYGLLYALSPRSSKNVDRRASYPKGLAGLERRGWLYGPVAYLRGRRQLLARRSRRTA